MTLAGETSFLSPVLRDIQYTKIGMPLDELEHLYGEQVHLLNDPYLFSLLAKLCKPDCKQPLVNYLVAHLYQNLFSFAINRELSLVETPVTTRMAEDHPEGTFNAKMVDPETRVVLVNLARAGTLPSQVCFDAVNYLLSPDNVRQDHISINRKIDANEKVIGTNLGGVKIGGGVDGAYVFFPDPMGATGSTVKTALRIYRDEVEGDVKKYLALHLIITPEYLSGIKEFFPELSVYALRLDRGLSPKDVLNTIPGTHWEKECGLNSKQYIVPGAGGIGEVINNAYV